MVGGGRKKANKCHPEKDSLSVDDTQPVDTQISPQSLPGENHELYNDHKLAPDDEHLFFNDAFERQLVNLCGENQFCDIGGETQLVDLAVIHKLWISVVKHSWWILVVKLNRWS